MHCFLCGLLLIFLLLGCNGVVSREDFEDARSDLNRCEGNLQQKEQELAQLRSIPCPDNPPDDPVIERGVLGEIVEWQQEIETSLPGVVEEKVGRSQEMFIRRMRDQFEQISEQNRSLEARLASYEKILGDLSVDMGATREEILEKIEEAGRRSEEDELQRGGVAEQAASLIEQVQGFQQNHIVCRSCPGKLRLSKREIEAISGFHAQLVRELSRLGQEETGRR